MQQTSEYNNNSKNQTPGSRELVVTTGERGGATQRRRIKSYKQCNMRTHRHRKGGLPGGTVVKTLPANAEDPREAALIGP